MKRITFIVAVLFAPLFFQACGTAPNERVATVQTLLVAGQSAEAAVSLSAQLYQNGQITADQARSVMDFYNQKWQPAYRIAVNAAQNDLNSYASPELWALLAQLSNLVNSFTSRPPQP